MTDWFVSAHPGAVVWARRRGITARVVAHFDPMEVKAGDRVFGTLPVPLAAAVCAAGGEYWHLTLDLAPGARHRELSADEMEQLGARLEGFVVRERGDGAETLDLAEGICR